ncbi:DUF3024 domain-containing protein [Paenibacillus agri]|nr:DUF3024 domain-containing protein [Paenibacillus agri]
MLDPFTKKRIEKIMDHYIKVQNSGRSNPQRKLKYRIHEDTVTLLDERPILLNGQWIEWGIAQFCRSEQGWGIYWRDLKNHWHALDNIKPDTDFEKQLKIVKQDCQGIFGD